MLKVCRGGQPPGVDVPGCRLRWGATSESLATDFGAGDVRASEAVTAPLRSFFCAAAASALASASAAWNCAQGTQRGVHLVTHEEVMLLHPFILPSDESRLSYDMIQLPCTTKLWSLNGVQCPCNQKQEEHAHDNNRQQTLEWPKRFHVN